MTRERCKSVQASFSAYLDGAVNGHEMQEIARHLEGSNAGSEAPSIARSVPPCQDCTREFVAWRTAQQALALLGPAKAPTDLSLKLRLAISREQSRRSVRLLDRISLTWDNAVRPLLVQVSAGAAAAVVLIGGILVLLGAVAPSQAVLADDEPLGAITAPHYLYSTSSPGAIVTGRDTAIVVEAAVDSSGRVFDYTIVSGPADDAVRIQVADQLLGSVFQPASVFGVPVTGHVVVTYSGISVRA